MDDQRFDALTRSLPAIRGRRDLLRLLAGGAVSGVATLLGRPGHDAAAHDATRECGKIEDRQRRQQCLKRAKQHNWKHTLVCTGGSPDARPPCGDNPACSCYAAIACNGGFCAVAGG